MSIIVRRFPDGAALTTAALETIGRAARTAVSQRGHFTLALSGGSSPLPLYRAMARKGLGVPFDAVRFFFGDERLVPVGDRRSTFGAITPLLFTHAPIPVGNIHPMPVEIRPATLAAETYETEIREAFGAMPGTIPKFDLVLLGLGPDGHTASLSPNSPALGESVRLVAAVPPPATAEPRVARLTFTLPLINAARLVLFLVASRGKEKALEKALSGIPDVAIPASLVQPDDDLLWFINDA
ncbi:MAG: 6-phosphogluconolactonase [Solidesulfovibrio sp.]